MQVPLVDLRAAFAPVKEQVFREFESILDGMQLFEGPNAVGFEREFADYCGATHGLGIANGTEALFAAIAACGIGPGDEVIAPAHTFFATTEAIVHAGGVPVLVDVEPDTLTLDPAAVERAVTARTRAIVPVHLYGQTADMDPILEIARTHDLRVVEDAAQAHGAKYEGRAAGSLGDAASFSFYFTKNLGGVGEGGFVTTSDDEIAAKVRLLRHHGHASKFEHVIVGYNLRMDELQAAVLRAKLPRLDAANAARRRHAAHYDRLFADKPVCVPTARPGREHVYHCYAVRVSDRDGLAAHLGSKGVGTGIHYKTPGHLQPALKGVPHRAEPLDVTIEACRDLISLPMFPELTEEQVEYVATQVLEFVGA